MIPQPEVQQVEAWKCFHCGETFTNEACARRHFGPDEQSVAACVIKAGAEGSILRALRDAEASEAKAWHLLHDECSDFSKAYYAQQSRHNQALIAAEELGYERGIRDLQAEVAAAFEAGRAEGVREAVEVCVQQREAFASTSYTAKSADSFQERFACTQCEAAIRALSKEPTK
jgi:hypothetical protein